MNCTGWPGMRLSILFSGRTLLTWKNSEMLRKITTLVTGHCLLWSQLLEYGTSCFLRGVPFRLLEEYVNNARFLMFSANNPEPNWFQYQSIIQVNLLFSTFSIDFKLVFISFTSVGFDPVRNVARLLILDYLRPTCIF